MIAHHLARTLHTLSMRLYLVNKNRLLVVTPGGQRQRRERESEAPIHTKATVTFLLWETPTRLLEAVGFLRPAAALAGEGRKRPGSASAPPPGKRRACERPTTLSPPARQRARIFTGGSTTSYAPPAMSAAGDCPKASRVFQDFPAERGASPSAEQAARWRQSPPRATTRTGKRPA